MKVYWWNSKPNFGDQLAPFLLERLCDLTPIWTPPHEAEVVLVGSVIDVLPASWSGIIAGAGKLRRSSPIPPRAEVLGVRGRLTVEPLPDRVAIGDPGLLVDELIPPQERVHRLGVIPHWTDHVLVPRFAHLNPFVIYPSWDPVRVITEIARCQKLVSSSLHGIVVADAFGIPRRAETFPKMVTYREGGPFKYEDYATGIDFPLTFGVVQRPPRANIERAQDQLFEMMMQLRARGHDG